MREGHAPGCAPGLGTLLLLEIRRAEALAGIAFAAAPIDMPILEFVDSAGVAWRVWNTVPSARTTLSGEFERGWLTFESSVGLRRLAPVPEGWEGAQPEKLELMCRAATEVARRTGPATGSEASADTL